MEWYYLAPDGCYYGPSPLSKMENWLRKGKIPHHTPISPAAHGPFFPACHYWHIQNAELKRDIGYNAWFFRKSDMCDAPEDRDLPPTEDFAADPNGYNNSSSRMSTFNGPSKGQQALGPGAEEFPTEQGPFTLYEMWDMFRRYELEPHYLVRMMNIRQDFPLRDVWPQWDTVFRLPESFVSLDAAERMQIDDSDTRNPINLLDGEWFYGKKGENKYTCQSGKFTQLISETGEKIFTDLEQHIDGWAWGHLEAEGTFALKKRGKVYVESKFKPYGESGWTPSLYAWPKFSYRHAGSWKGPFTHEQCRQWFLESRFDNKTQFKIGSRNQIFLLRDLFPEGNAFDEKGLTESANPDGEASLNLVTLDEVTKTREKEKKEGADPDKTVTGENGGAGAGTSGNRSSAVSGRASGDKSAGDAEDAEYQVQTRAWWTKNGGGQWEATTKGEYGGNPNADADSSAGWNTANNGYWQGSANDWYTQQAANDWSASTGWNGGEALAGNYSYAGGNDWYAGGNDWYSAGNDWNAAA